MANLGRTLAFRLSQAVQNTASPPIPQAYKWALSYMATEGKALLDMSQGVPATPPPKVVLDSLSTVASDPRICGYCPVSGELGMRDALAREMKVVYGGDIDVTSEDIALTAGCNMAFVASIMSLADAGDEVIIPVPWYFNHQMSLEMLGIKTVPLQTFSREAFIPSPERCAELITSKTKAIVLVTPNNPTGATYSPCLISSFAMLAMKHNIALVIDETYRDFIPEGIPHNLFLSGLNRQIPALSVDWSWRNHFIHLFSFSKSYCVPGHRLGAIVASPAVLEHIKTVLDCIQICAPRAIQLALYPLLPQLRGFVREAAQTLIHRHELFRSLLPPSWHIGSHGAYYAFVRHPFKNISAVDVSRRLATELGVITLPAQFFTPRVDEGQKTGDEERWIRFSVANVDDEKVRKVCERLSECESQFGWAVEQPEH